MTSDGAQAENDVREDRLRAPASDHRIRTVDGSLIMLTFDVDTDPSARRR